MAARQQGVLGARPPQSFYTATPAPSVYTPTDIDQALHTLSLNQPDENWYMDTGATSHMTANPGTLTSYFNLSKPNGILVGNGSMIPIRGYGNTSLTKTNPPLHLKNVLHAPNLIKNLISVRKFTNDNMVSVEFDPFGFSVKDLQTGSKLLRCESTGELYPFTTKNRAISSSAPSAFTIISPSIWHSRLGHPGDAILSTLRQNNFISCNKARNLFCSSCPLGKFVKLPFYDSLSFTTMPFDIIHSDLWTSPILSSSGHRYYALFLDDYTNFLWTFPLSQKSQVHNIFLSFRAYIKTQFEREIKSFQCDNGREYDNGPFHKFCEQHGMSFRFSCPHTSPQNGKAERKIKSINNIVRTLLAHSSLPPSFWHHALQMATYLLNILPTKVLGYKSPTQILYQKNPSYSHLRVFGCLCFPLFPSTTINKLQARSTPCVFLGYPSNHRGYKCYDLSARKIIISRHVHFDETQFPFSKIHTPNTHTYDFLEDGLSPLQIHNLHQNVAQNQQNQLPQSPSPAQAPVLTLSPLQAALSPPRTPSHFSGPGPNHPSIVYLTKPLYTTSSKIWALFSKPSSPPSTAHTSLPTTSPANDYS